MSFSSYQGNIVSELLVVQWLRLCTSTAGGMGYIPGQGTKTPHAVQQDKKKAGNIISV